MRKRYPMLMLSFARQGRQRAHAEDNQGKQKASFAHAVYDACIWVVGHSDVQKRSDINVSFGREGRERAHACGRQPRQTVSTCGRD